MADVPANANPGCVGTTSALAGKASACGGCPNQESCSSGPNDRAMSDVPANANQGCVGTSSKLAGKASACGGCPNQNSCASNSKDQPMTDVPANANDGCVGTSSALAGKAAACRGCPNQEACATAPKGPDPDLQSVADRMQNVAHKIMVLSGKGGVGKSTFSAQLAFALAAKGKQVGLLDIDICGPSIPKMLGLEGQEIHVSNLGWSPVYVEDNLGVMSIGFMLPDPDDAVVWRGPRKNGLIKQFLKDVDWGNADYLVIDSPPGTSDEHISIAQYLKGCQVDGAIIITTPQEVSVIDVRKEISFCKKVGIKILGVVENMSGLQVPFDEMQFRDLSGGQDRDVTAEVMAAIKNAVPDISKYTAHVDVFKATKGGGEAMAQMLGLPFLGRIPLDLSIGRAAEEGRSCFTSPDSPGVKAMDALINRLVAKLEA
eukprot:jgi/Mesvir1/8375/Mv12624-RA.1